MVCYALLRVSVCPVSNTCTNREEDELKNNGSLVWYNLYDNILNDVLYQVTSLSPIILNTVCLQLSICHLNIYAKKLHSHLKEQTELSMTHDFSTSFFLVQIQWYKYSILEGYN